MIIQVTIFNGFLFYKNNFYILIILTEYLVKMCGTKFVVNSDVAFIFTSVLFTCKITMSNM